MVNELGLTALLGVVSIAASSCSTGHSCFVGGPRACGGQGCADPTGRDACSCPRGAHRHHVRAGGRRPADVHADGRPTGRGPVPGRPARERHRPVRGHRPVMVWVAIAASYRTDWPIGFFVGTISAIAYLGGRSWAWRRARRVGGSPAFAGSDTGARPVVAG